MTPSIGRIVHYTLSEQDADAINRRRADAIRGRTADEHSGVILHSGNTTNAGDVYPAIVVRVFPGGTEANGVCNLQVLLDGNDTYWATSRAEGDGQLHWCWPPRV
jgi:hypothetical protein